MRFLLCLGVVAVSGTFFQVAIVLPDGTQKVINNERMTPRRTTIGDMMSGRKNDKVDSHYHGDAHLIPIDEDGIEALVCLDKDGLEYGSYIYPLRDEGPRRLDVDYYPRTYVQSDAGIAKTEERAFTPENFVINVTDYSRASLPVIWENVDPKVMRVDSTTKQLHRALRKFCNVIARYHANEVRPQSAARAPSQPDPLRMSSFKLIDPSKRRRPSPP